MSPRGVAISGVRQQLFAALERVIARDGPSALSGRAVTREAGVAVGLLHAHFADFDAFLVGFAVDRSFQAAAYAAALPERAGRSTVTDNLIEAVLAPPVLALAPLVSLMATRPALQGLVEEVLGHGAAGLDAVRTGVAAYLSEERQRGRLAADADPDAIALALVGTLHHLLLTGRLEDGLTGRKDDKGTPTRAAARRLIARVVDALVGAPASGGGHARALPPPGAGGRGAGRGTHPLP